MNVQSINSCVNKQVNFKASSGNKSNTESQKGPGFLDVFATSAKNSADLNDTVVVPRTIFKGYLGFMAGTALGALAPLAKNKKGLYAGLHVAAGALALLGTYFFARPYIIKDANPKKNEGNLQNTKQEAQIIEKTPEKEPQISTPAQVPNTQQPVSAPLSGGNTITVD